MFGILFLFQNAQKGARIKGYAFVSFDSGALAQGGVDVAGVEAALRACTDLRNRVVNQVRYRCELGNRLQKQAASMGLAPMNPIPSVGGMNGMNNMGMNTHMGNTLPCITPGGYMTPNTVYQQPLTSYPPTCVPQYQSPPEQAQGFTVYTPSFAPSPYASREGTPTNYQLRMQQLASQMAQAQAQQAQVQQAQVQQAGPPQMQQLMQQHQLPVPPPLPLQQQAAQPQYVPQLGYTPLHTPTNGNLLTSVGVMLQQQQLAQQHQAHHQAHQSHPAVSPHSSHPAQGLSYHAQLAAQAQAQLQAQALAQASLHPPQYVQYQYYPSGLNSGCNSGAATPVSVARAALTASQVQGVGVPGVPGQMVMSMPGMMMVPMAMQNLSMPNMHGYPQHQHHTPAYTPTAYAHHQAQHAAQQAQAQAQQQAAHQQQQGQQGHAHPAQGPSALQHHAQQQQGILKELSCSQHFAAKGIKLSIKTHSFDEPSPAPQPAQRSYSTECTPRELYLQRKQQQGQNPASRRAQYANSNSNNTNVNNTSTNTISYNNASSNNTSQAFSPNASTPVTVHEHKPASRRGSNDSITTTSLYLGNMSIDESSEFQESRGDRCDKIDRCDRGDRGDTDVETPVSV